MTTQEAYEAIVGIINQIKVTDDKVLEVTGKLKIVLLNLQIEKGFI